MAVITIASQKGGVGKTTTALNLGFSLSRLGMRPLIVDGDPQGAIAAASNLKKKTELGLADVIKDRVRPADVVMYTRDNQMAVVGMGDMDPEDVEALESAARSGAMIELIAALAKGFDLAILDAPAGIGGLAKALMTASDRVLLPMTPRSLNVKTLPAFLKTVGWLRHNGAPALALEGVVLTMVDENNETERGVIGEIQSLVPPELLLDTRIPADPAFEKAGIQGIPVGMLRDGSVAARAYLDLAMELKDRIAPAQGGGDEESPGLF